MTNEDALKEILRGQSGLSEELIQRVERDGLALAPQLLTLIRNIRLWHTEDVGQWAVLHSIRLAGSLDLSEVKTAIPALIDAIFLAYGTRHEEALEDLPIALARTGKNAVRPLESVVEDPALDTTIRSVAASALEGVAVLNPEVRGQVLDIFRKIVAAPSDLSGVRGHVISILAHFRDPEDRGLIKQVARSVPMMLDMDGDEIDEYFNEDKDPESWATYRGSLLDYYR